MALRLYTVHLPPPSADDSTPVLIKEGFSWGAFFFNVLWAVWHKLWIEAAALIALLLALGVISDFIDLTDSVETAIMLAVAVLIGFGGSDWRRESFRRRGYRDAGVVSGPNQEDALRRFLDLRAIDGQRSPPPPPTYQDPAALFPAPLPASTPTTPGGGPPTGSIAGWYASSNSQPPGQSRPLDPTALRSTVTQDRLTMQSQPIPESSDPRRPASDYRSAGSILGGSDHGSSGTGSFGTGGFGG